MNNFVWEKRATPTALLKEQLNNINIEMHPRAKPTAIFRFYSLTLAFSTLHCCLFLLIFWYFLIFYAKNEQKTAVAIVNLYGSHLLIKKKLKLHTAKDFVSFHCQLCEATLNYSTLYQIHIYTHIVYHLSK